MASAFGTKELISWINWCLLVLSDYSVHFHSISCFGGEKDKTVGPVLQFCSVISNYNQIFQLSKWVYSIKAQKFLFHVCVRPFSLCCLVTVNVCIICHGSSSLMISKGWEKYTMTQRCKWYWCVISDTFSSAYSRIYSTVFRSMLFVIYFPCYIKLVYKCGLIRDFW